MSNELYECPICSESVPMVQTMLIEHDNGIRFAEMDSHRICLYSNMERTPRGEHFEIDPNGIVYKVDRHGTVKGAATENELYSRRNLTVSTLSDSEDD
jgi:hypothetical protein